MCLLRGVRHRSEHSAYDARPGGDIHLEHDYPKKCFYRIRTYLHARSNLLACQTFNQERYGLEFSRCQAKLLDQPGQALRSVGLPFEQDCKANRLVAANLPIAAKGSARVFALSRCDLVDKHRVSSSVGLQEPEFDLVADKQQRLMNLSWICRIRKDLEDSGIESDWTERLIQQDKSGTTMYAMHAIHPIRTAFVEGAPRYVRSS